MTATLEVKKLRRTGYFPALLGSALLSAAVPAVNMAARGETYLAQSGGAIEILLDANWQMMAMLNVLSTLCAACLMFRAEYAQNALDKLEVMPVRVFSVYLGKAVLAVFMLAVMTAVEFVSLHLCARHWFGESVDIARLLSLAGYALAAGIPTLLASLAVAAACRNMWVSLGIGLTLVFTLSVFPQDNAVIRLLPYATPYTTALEGSVTTVLIACAAESAVLLSLGPAILKARRRFE